MVNIKSKHFDDLKGEISDSQVPELDTLSSGTFDVTDIPDIDADKVVSGTFDIARLAPNAHYGTIDTADVTSGTFVDARIPNLDTAKITSGTFDSERISSTAGGGIGTFYHGSGHRVGTAWTEVKAFALSSDGVLDFDVFGTSGGVGTCNFSTPLMFQQVTHEGGAAMRTIRPVSTPSVNSIMQYLPTIAAKSGASVYLNVQNNGVLGSSGVAQPSTYNIFVTTETGAKMYKLDQDGSILGSYTSPVSDITHDGTYIWLGNHLNQYAEKYDETMSIQSSFDTTKANVRGIAYDKSTEHLFVGPGGDGGYVHEYNKAGAVQGSFITTYQGYNDFRGSHLFVFSNNTTPLRKYDTSGVLIGSLTMPVAGGGISLNRNDVMRYTGYHLHYVYSGTIDLDTMSFSGCHGSVNLISDNLWGIAQNIYPGDPYSTWTEGTYVNFNYRIGVIT